MMYRFPLFSWPEGSPQHEAARRACQLLQHEEGFAAGASRVASAILVDLTISLGNLRRAASLLEHTQVTLTDLGLPQLIDNMIKTRFGSQEQLDAFLEKAFSSARPESLNLALEIWNQLEQHDKVLTTSQSPVGEGIKRPRIHLLRARAFEKQFDYSRSAAEFVILADFDPDFGRKPENETLVALSRLMEFAPEKFKPLQERLEQSQNFDSLRKILLDAIRAHWPPSTGRALQLLGGPCEKEWSTACVWLFGALGFPEDVRSDGAVKALDRCITQAMKRRLGIDPSTHQKLSELVAEFERAMKDVGLASRAARQYLEDVNKHRTKSTHENSVDLSKARDLHRYALGVIVEISKLLQEKQIDGGKR